MLTAASKALVRHFSALKIKTISPGFFVFRSAAVSRRYEKKNIPDRSRVNFNGDTASPSIGSAINAIVLASKADAIRIFESSLRSIA